MRNRRNLILAGFAVLLVVVLLLGLTRGSNDKAPSAVTTTTVEGPSSDAIGNVGAYLHPAEKKTDVSSDACADLVTDDPSPTCEAFEINGTLVAWAVDQSGSKAPVASFFRKEGPTWVRKLTAAGDGQFGFDTVNVRTDDLTGDGEVETIFGFHAGRDLYVDVVSPGGDVLLHLNLGTGQVLVGGGQLVTFVRRGPSTFERAEITSVDGKLAVKSKKTVKGPASGNL